MKQLNATVPAEAGPKASPAEARSQEDLTGLERIPRNVLTSWAAHLAIIAAGFVVPRMINDRLGQAILGVWDFSWSLVSYFGLVQGGVVSSINRYVAMHRATGDQAAVNRAVSSVTWILWVMAGIVVLLAVATVWSLPLLWGKRLGPDVRDAQWVVMLLGLALALQIAYSGYGGIITGCHRWDLHNGIYGGTCLFASAAMIVVLLVGGGLPALAGVYLAGEAAGRWLRRLMAFRVCPGLEIRLNLANWQTAREMLGFGAKAFVPTVGQLLLNQTVNLLIVGYLGPAALAVYSRPTTLVRHIMTLVIKFASVLTPTASSLHASDSRAEVREFAVLTTRCGALIALPMLLTLAVLGGPILRIWMGSAYVYGHLTLILGSGYIAAVAQQPLISILNGLNAHGRPGLASFVASTFSAVLAFTALKWVGTDLDVVALSVVLPLTASYLVYLPLHARQVLGLRLRQYVRRVWLEPCLYCLPFALCLLGARYFVSRSPLATVVYGMSTGSILLGIVYWCLVVPQRFRQRILARLLSLPLVRRGDCAR